MPTPKLANTWDNICNQYLSGNIPKPTKLAAYKVFLRPILTYFWFDERRNLQALELKALRKIFGNSDIDDLYSKYPDLELPKLLTMQELRWNHATGGFARVTKKIITKSMKNCDVTSVFGVPVKKKSKNKVESSRNLNVGIVIADEGDRPVALRRSNRLASRRRSNLA